MTPKQLRDAANGPWEVGDMVIDGEGREVGVVTKVEPVFCGKCSRGYVYHKGDNFVGERCKCNPYVDPMDSD